MQRIAVCLAAALCAFAPYAAHADVPSATTQDGKVRVDVTSLKRSEGDTVTLRIAVTNNGNQDFSIVLGNMRLIDLVARRSYDAGLTATSCATPPGKQTACWAMYAAPPPNTKTMSIKFYEPIDLLTGVPVTD